MWAISFFEANVAAFQTDVDPPADHLGPKCQLHGMEMARGIRPYDKKKQYGMGRPPPHRADRGQYLWGDSLDIRHCCQSWQFDADLVGARHSTAKRTNGDVRGRFIANRAVARHSDAGGCGGCGGERMNAAAAAVLLSFFNINRNIKFFFSKLLVRIQ